MRAGRRQLRTARGLNRAPALHRRGVQQADPIPVARTIAGERGHDPLDLLGQPRAALPQRVLGRQDGKQPDELTLGHPQEPSIGADAQHRLGDAQRDDLRIGDSSTGVPGPLGHQIVCGTEHRSEQQVEVGEHRGPSGRRRGQSTADFDLRSITPATPTGVASTI